MYNNGWIILLLVLTTSFQAKSTSIDLSQVPNIKSQSYCFSGAFQSFDSWLSQLKQSKKASFEQRGIENYQKQMKRFESNFKSIFSKEAFDEAKAQLDCRFFTYSVNGQDVKGVIISPLGKAHPKASSPVMIYNRGGTRNLGSLVFGHIFHELFPLAQAGYTIIASNYRDDEQYGADNIDEVVALFDILDAIPNINAHKVNLYGISRGGLTAFQLAKAVPSRVSTIVTVNGVTNAELWAENRAGIKHNISLIKGYHDNAPAVFNKISPIKWVDALPNVPILLVHSKDDKKVRYEHSQQIAQQLTSFNRQFTLKSFETGGHSLGSNKPLATQYIINWLRTH